MTREDKAIELLKTLEAGIFQEDNLSHMSGDLDMCGTTITQQAINPKRMKQYLKCKKCWDKAVRQANKDTDPKYNNLPPVEF